MNGREHWRCVTWVAGAAIAIALLLASFEPNRPRFVTQSTEAGQRVSTRYVQVRSDVSSVVFTNGDGEWTIFKRCLGTDVAGAGYIARFVSRLGYVVSNDYQEGGAGELNNPEHGGIGTFGLELARGEGPRDWNNTWHLSMRRCGPWGITRWSVPAVGFLSDGSAYYHQDVWLSDGWAELFRIRYRWRFRRTGVDLHGLVRSLCNQGRQQCASPLGPAYVKEPKLVVVLNGQASEERFRHMSTFTDTGRFLARSESAHDDECSYAGFNARKETGHCFHEARERVRWDYRDDGQGGCNVTTRLCFNAVIRSVSGPWEDETSRAGLEGWAYDAAEQPRAGVEGCVTIDGQVVDSPAQENARNWEYAVLAEAEGEPYRGSMVMAKGWDGCRNSLDATSLYRKLEPGAYGFFLSLSLGSGWARR